MDAREKILSQINFVEFYSRYLNDFKDTGSNVLCPFHKDTNGSLSIDTEKGLWFCHSCDIGGSIFDFYMKVFDVDFKSSLIIIAKEFKIDIKEFNTVRNLNNSLSRVDVCHKDLMSNIHESLKYVIEQRGLSLEIIKQYKIGYLKDKKRTAFPIFDIYDNLLNIRQHSRHPGDREKGYKVIGVKGYNKVVLYPASALNQDEIFIFAGEFDCMLAQSLGIPGAITKTGPENQWNNEWNILFKDKKVAIVYDNDKAGKLGALKIAESVSSANNKVKIVELPLSDKGEDFTDFIIKHNNTVKDFISIVKVTNEYIKRGIDPGEIDTDVYKVKLEESSLDKYFHKQVIFKAICAGKDLNPFLVPRKIEISCNMFKGRDCAFCPLQAARGKMIVNYDKNDPDVLEFVGASQTQKKGIIKKKADINNCNILKINILEAQNIEECFLVPAIDFKEVAYEDTYRKIFYLGQGLTLNHTYDFEGLTVPDPRDQHAVVMINKLSDSDTDIDSFKMTDEIYKQLQIFQPKRNSSEYIKEKLEDKYNDLSEHVTQIYNRFDLHMAIDLVFHSALKFKFQNVEIEKSHVEGLIIGDTRTGKSVTAKRLINHYRAGEMINCEKATIPGLIGGTHDIGSRKILTWGIIPRNDRRLVVLDEADGIDTDIISNLSGVRSSCIAERTIAGGTRKALARTRMLWLSNPRGFKNLSEYATGIEAVKALIGKPEDIARFDFAMAISQNDVPVEVINKIRVIGGNIKYTSDLCNKLLIWAWSRKEEQIEFTEDAIRQILTYAIGLGTLFSSNIPIVHPNEQRIKIARLATSLAMMCFSTDDGNNVVIRTHHVKYIIEYLMEIYSSPALAYLDYSKDKITSNTIANEGEVRVKIINGFISSTYDTRYNSKYFISRMVGSYKLKFDDIMDALQAGDDQRKDVKEVRQYLLLNRCIVKEYSYWKVTEPFRFLLRKMQKEIENE